MTKTDLLKILADLPDDAPIFVCCESGADLVKSVELTQVKKTKTDWRDTPVGNYRTVDDCEYIETIGDPLNVILIGF